MRFLSVGLTILLLLTASTSQAANKGSSKGTAKSAVSESSTDGTALMPEVIGAKAFLEDLIVHRYAQELSTTVDRSSFSLGAQLELAELPKPTKVDEPESNSDTPADLLLGTLDPEELLKKFDAEPELVDGIRGFLKRYRIKTVVVSVGLKPEIGLEAKNRVEKWLDSRVQSEFGQVGKSLVSSIELPVEKKTNPKNLWDWLSQFQALAGQALIALAILLFAVLWQVLGRGKEITADKGEADSAAGASSSASEAASDPSPFASSSLDDAKAAAAAAAEKKDQEIQAGAEESDAVRVRKEFRSVSKRIFTLAAKTAADHVNVIRSWCQMGEEGKLRLACFVEAVGIELGKLPIPPDAAMELSKTFSAMPSMPVAEKCGILSKVYWDLLAAANLGTEALERPFAYLESATLGKVDQVLIDQNPKMRTLVTLLMPKPLRESYVRGLDLVQKKSLITAAAGMRDIALDEYKSYDGVMRSKLLGSKVGTSIPLDRSLKSILEALTPLDEIQLLSEMPAALFEDYKRSTPSLAFIDQWETSKLGALLSRALPDEIVAFLRVRPSLQVRVLPLCSQMTAEVAVDELSRPDTTRAPEKNKQLELLAQRMLDMISRKEVSLDEVFGENQTGNQSSSGSDVRDEAA